MPDHDGRDDLHEHIRYVIRFAWTHDEIDTILLLVRLVGIDAVRSENPYAARTGKGPR